METAKCIAKRLTEALNRHGYVFQHRVLKEAEDNFEQRISTTWLFEASEVPVEVNGVGTRIDFVLKSRRTTMCLLCECKRVNPSLSNWCFAKAPYIGRDATAGALIAEYCRMVNHNCVSTGAVVRYIHRDDYHVALPVRSDAKGDARGGSEDAIETAASQVCRGVNGLVEMYAHKTTLFEGKGAIVIIPVIFTTARLWSTEVSFKEADVVTGTLADEQVHVAEQEWLYYQYHQSPGLKHSLRRPATQNKHSLSSWVEADSIRTIVIVNASASQKFLASFHDDIHGLTPL